MAMKIDTVAPGSDAAALGLSPGDELLSVDGLCPMGAAAPGHAPQAPLRLCPPPGRRGTDI